MDNWLFGIPLGFLWFSPVIAGAITFFTRNRPGYHKKIFKGALIYFACFIILSYFEISTIWQRINFILFCSQYLVICLMLFIGAMHHIRSIKIGSRVAVLIVIGFGYFMGTLGILGIGFLVDGIVVEKSIPITNNIVLRQRVDGVAVSKFRGNSVSLYKHLSVFPWVEKLMVEKQYNYFGLAKYITKGFTGSDLYFQYDSINNTLIVRGSESGVDSIRLN